MTLNEQGRNKKLFRPQKKTGRANLNQQHLNAAVKSKRKMKSYILKISAKAKKPLHKKCDDTNNTLQLPWQTINKNAKN